MRSIGFTLDRLRATGAAQSILAVEWVWLGETVVGWDGSILTLEEQIAAALAAEAVMEVVRGSLDGDLAELHNKTLVWGTFFKLAYRNDPDNAKVVKSIRARAGSRARIIKNATAFESKWEEVNATWVPEVGQTLALFTAFRQACEAKMYAYNKAKVAWRKAAETLNNMADELDDKCIAWYAAATVRFPEGTVEGDMIRGTVPTTTDFTPLPGQAQIQLESAPEPLSYAVMVSAEHATKFDIYQRILGETEWLKVGVDVLPGLYVKTGLVAGDYEVKAQPRNSRGAGPDSDALTISVS